MAKWNWGIVGLDTEADTDSDDEEVGISIEGLFVRSDMDTEVVLGACSEPAAA